MSLPILFNGIQSIPSTSVKCEHDSPPLVSTPLCSPLVVSLRYLLYSLRPSGCLTRYPPHSILLSFCSYQPAHVGWSFSTPATAHHPPINIFGSLFFFLSISPPEIPHQPHSHTHTHKMIPIRASHLYATTRRESAN
ncbi:hypothetical protein I7I53_06516 [Histoplasma capsulatum var. duboisii H88]|uniref:Uncharacterized protein n=1 Tax=Ajellomyces capsulatus (strain H88) TaxID=544711 RepID=A0A8A1LB01_AJEC8|nr:hypothetical protein I7I53_06516 [Histoplasma capsulatum var. duboisii H88]